MKIKNGFVLREVAGNYIVVSVGERVKEFNGVVNLNSTSAFLWKALEQEITEEELVEKICNEYNVDKETASVDIKNFITKLKEAGFLE